MQIRLISTAIFILAAIGLGFGLLLPAAQELSETEADIELKEIELRFHREYFLNLAQISEKLEEHQSSLDKMEAALPLDSTLPSMFNFFQKISSQSGLILESVSPLAASTMADKPEIQEYSLDLSLSGSYAGLKSFLSALEKSARLIEVRSISFSSPQKGAAFKFSISLIFHSY